MPDGILPAEPEFILIILCFDPFRPQLLSCLAQLRSEWFRNLIVAAADLFRACDILLDESLVQFAQRLCQVITEAAALFRPLQRTVIRRQHLSDDFSQRG